MANNDIQAVKDLVDLPIGDMLRAIAVGIADAQFQLDKSSMTVTELMSGTRMLRDLDTGKLIDGDGNETTTPVMLDSRIFFGYHLENGRRVPDKLSMMELGFTPTFYQFVDTVIEVKVAVRMTRSEPTDASNGEPDYHVNTTPVDAGYCGSYGFNAEFASSVKTKLVAVPPPASLEERVARLARQESESPEPAAPGADATPLETPETRTIEAPAEEPGAAGKTASRKKAKKTTKSKKKATKARKASKAKRTTTAKKTKTAKRSRAKKGKKR